MKKSNGLKSRKRSEGIAPPERFAFGEDLRWNAPWIDVKLWVELPFWLMANNAGLSICIEHHEFPVTIHDNYFELFANAARDSKLTIIYRGPHKELDDLSKPITEWRKKNPRIPVMWRKCKTVVKIATRCNTDVWDKAKKAGIRPPPSVSAYLSTLCKAHLPVINKLIQGYRLATYDYFPYEVAPWDIPYWIIEGNGGSISSLIQPYRGWDMKPMISRKSGSPVPFQLIDTSTLASELLKSASPGEWELLDALNFMERGDYSDAVRRITTAVEVVVAYAVAKEIEAAQGKVCAEAFLEKTKMNFPERVKKYQQVTCRKLPDTLQQELNNTRQIRNRIVHGGYRIAHGERGTAQRSVDTGRWLFNWFENDASRAKVREERIAFRSLGRDVADFVFNSRIQADGVVVSSPF